MKSLCGAFHTLSFPLLLLSLLVLLVLPQPLLLHVKLVHLHLLKYLGQHWTVPEAQALIIFVCLWSGVYNRFAQVIFDLILNTQNKGLIYEHPLNV